MMKKLAYFLLILVAILFEGCSSKGGEQTKAVYPPSVTPVITDGRGSWPGAGSSGDIFGGGNGGLGGGGDGSAFGAPNGRVVYFDFDRYDIRSDGRSVVETHAAFLTRNPNVPVRLEGHADERGSREYNLALGEKRANSVRDALTILGVNPLQITTLSYGEERPVDRGNNEMAWQLNRRVELVY